MLFLGLRDNNNIINVHHQFSAYHTLEYAIHSPPVCGSCILETALLSTHRHQLWTRASKCGLVNIFFGDWHLVIP